MKVVLQRRERKTGVTFLLLFVCALLTQHALQAQKITSSSTSHPTSRLGEVKVDIQSLQPSRLLEALRSNVFTDVTVEVAGQPRTFRVSVSSRVTILNGGESVYDGPDQSDPKNKIFILVSEQRADITITLGDREYLITPTENVDDKNSAQKGQVAKGVTTFGAYSLIDQHELSKWMANNVPAGRSVETTPLDCGTDVLAKKNSARARNWDYSSNRIGYIGKRDLYLHVYGDINQARFPTFVNNMNNIFTHDDRFNDIRLVVIKHARGETSNQIIDEYNLPWRNDAYAFLDAFADQLMTDPAFKYYDNEYHMYLSNKHWDNAYGAANSSPGTASIARYEVSSPYQIGITVPLHEFSHNLGALHTNDIYSNGGSTYNDLMKSGDASIFSRGPRLTWHYNAANRDRIHNEVSTVSIKDEVLDGTYTPTIRHPHIGEDLVIVVGNTNDTSITPTPPDTEKPFDEGGPDGSSRNRWKINVYKMKVPRVGSSNQTFLQARITEADFDTYLYILDENGNLISKDDDSGFTKGSGLFGYDSPGKSYLSGYFNADKYYYFIVRGWYFSGIAGNGKFELKIRYSSWYTEDWLTKKTSTTRQGSELAPLVMSDSPDQSQMLMAKDGSLISVADFGINDKSLTPEEAPQMSLNVYPNPVKDGVLHVQQDGLTIYDTYTLFNSEGKVMQEGKLQPAGKNGLSIKLLPSAKGLLLLRIKSTTGGSVRTAKIIVE